ncbi:MAG TPA: hypothetical protein VGO81_15115 [Solirubrobacteraceae bacterium]|jgi:hypothetical protein|nr:hypothetical protein [Solirubrobacteraceae bacterium]
MTLLRSLFEDLVEKRLWPIALLLAITAVAVPVALGRSGAGTSAPAAPPASAAGEGAAAATPAVEIVGPAAVRGRSGAVRDPFRRSTTAAAKTATHRGAGAKRSGTSDASSASTGATTDSTAAATTHRAPVAATPAAGVATGDAPAASVYRARVRWGQDEHAAVSGLSRLQPLGGSSNPGLLYLGTTQRGARAVFLLGPNAGAEGDGTCAEKTCRVMRLKAGDTTVVTVQGAEGSTPRRFTLVVDAIRRRGASSEAAARRLRARADRHGRDVLREIIKDSATAAAIGRFRFDRTLGAVVATTAP